VNGYTNKEIEEIRIVKAVKKVSQRIPMIFAIRLRRDGSAVADRPDTKAQRNTTLLLRMKGWCC